MSETARANPQLAKRLVAGERDLRTFMADKTSVEILNSVGDGASIGAWPCV
jgi:hypothetical protein